MFTVDTNILVYAHREEFDLHRKARAMLEELAAGDEPWVLFWPCIYEFVRVVTHPRLFHPATPTVIAETAMMELINHSSAVVLSETEHHTKWFSRILRETGCAGNHVFDAHIAALMRENGVSKIITRDKDFHQFEGIEVVIPF